MIILTACNEHFYESCKTLIASIHKYSFNDVSKIVILDLGINNTQKKELNNIRKCELIELPHDLINEYPHFLTPRTFAWKIFLIHKFGNGNEPFIYMDAGACFLNNIKEIENIITKEDIFLVEDENKNYQYTHENCFKIMRATEEEKLASQIWAGAQGYKPHGKFQTLLEDAYKYAKIKECIEGNGNHRHDQSIFSILRCRYNAPLQNINRFGQWKKQDIQDNTVIFAHRKSFTDQSGLLFSK